MNLGLSDRVAAVAGASAGLGFACAAALASEGVTVVICSRSEERVTAAARLIGPKAIPVVSNIDSLESGRAFVQDAAKALGRYPDIIVANSGGPPPGNLETTDLAAFLPALQQNLLSTVGMCHEALPSMKERRWGRVIAITSVAVKQPIPHLILSNTARTGLTAFLKTVATEVAPHGITVNSVLPGGHATDRIRKLYGDREDLGADNPIGRLGRPEDFGAAVAFLASEQAGFITGVSLPIDGGGVAGLF